MFVNYECTEFAHVPYRPLLMRTDFICFGDGAVVSSHGKVNNVF